MNEKVSFNKLAVDIKIPNKHGIPFLRIKHKILYQLFYIRSHAKA